MSLGLILGVAGAGAIGAMARFGAERAHARWRSRHRVRAGTDGQHLAFPWATLSVNVVGSALLGWVIAAQHAGVLSAAAAIILGMGFAGTLTTYSTFSLDAYLLLRSRENLRAWSYLLVSVLTSLAATVVGLTWGGR